MARTTNYPKDIFEQIDIELCQLERDVKKQFRQTFAGFATYNKHRLPMNLASGEGFFCADTGEFCIRYHDKIYCMPGPSVGGIGPLIYAIQKQTSVSFGGGTADIWKVATRDSSGNEITIRSDSNFHCSAPVWSTDFQKIIYQEGPIRRVGAPVNTVKLCAINADGSGRVVIDDTTLTDFSSYYYGDYCVSPDGQKVAWVGYVYGVAGVVLRCSFMDGSGDCGGGNLTSGNAYGNPQWSDDSQTIYLAGDTPSNPGPANINAYKFDGSDITEIYPSNDFDYMWLSNDKTRLASAWFGVSSSIFAILNVNGTLEHGYTDADCPWTGARWPTECFWAPDDSFLILTRQGASGHGGEIYEGNAVRVNPNNPSDYIFFHWPSEAQSRGVANWTLALDLAGNMKLYGECYNNDADGPSIYQWDVNTGEGEGWVLTSPNWDSTPPVWDRYHLGGLASVTMYFGTQIWDI